MEIASSDKPKLSVNWQKEVGDGVKRNINCAHDAPGFQDRFDHGLQTILNGIGWEMRKEALYPLYFIVLSTVFTDEDLSHYGGLLYPNLQLFLDTFYWMVIREYLISLTECCCIPGCKNQDLEVHHSDYAVCGQEHNHLDTLFVMCREHHQQQPRDCGINPYNKPRQGRTDAPGAPFCTICSERRKAKWLLAPLDHPDSCVVCDECRLLILDHKLENWFTTERYKHCLNTDFSNLDRLPHPVLWANILRKFGPSRYVIDA